MRLVVQIYLEISFLWSEIELDVSVNTLEPDVAFYIADGVLFFKGLAERVV